MQEVGTLKENVFQALCGRNITRLVKNKNKMTEKKRPGKKCLRSIMVVLEKRQQPQDTAEVTTNTLLSWRTKNIGGGKEKSFAEYDGDTS